MKPSESNQNPFTWSRTLLLVLAWLLGAAIPVVVHLVGQAFQPRPATDALEYRR